MTRLIAAAAALALLATPSLAVDSYEDTPPKQTQTSSECSNAQIWDEKTQTCVDARESHLDDDIRYDAARELAYAGQYANALKVLAAADNPQDPRILNYKGFATRKSGDLDKAIAYYRAALSIAPDYTLARSYMGQALIEKGDIDAAKAELVRIRSIAGRETWAYVALKQALQGKTGY